MTIARRSHIGLYRPLANVGMPELAVSWLTYRPFDDVRSIAFGFLFGVSKDKIASVCLYGEFTVSFFWIELGTEARAFWRALPYDKFSATAIRLHSIGVRHLADVAGV